MTMDRYVITGKQRLEGSIRTSGAKNASLPLMAAAILADGKTELQGIPHLTDILCMGEVLKSLGCKTQFGSNELTIDSSSLNDCIVDDALMRKMRASNLILGPMLVRNGRVKISRPGGCAIGTRPMDQHIKGLQELGVRVEERHGYIEATAGKLRGGDIYLDIPSVGATENIMMAACLADGTTLLKNAAKEPEVVNLADVLNGMGAKISGAGTDIIRIDGVEQLHPVEASVISDRIEAGTFMIAAGITGGDVRILECNPLHLDALILKLRDTGMEITTFDGGVRAVGKKKIKSVDIKTLPYPGFATDLQAQVMTLMAVASGLSVITETVFENRFMHVSELMRMGADILVHGNSAMVRGIPKLKGARVMATDLRASASLILAGLAAEGKTELSRVYHIDRGYEKIEKKLSAIGANITRVAG